MRRNILRITAVLAILCLSAVGCARLDSGRPVCAECYRQTIRVACVGDSITYGSGIKVRSGDSYPAQLATMLGDKWQVRNFGVGGATMLKSGDKPYWQQQAFTDALAYNPHVVIIKLGTNDTKPQNWEFKGDFVADYADMIDQFADLPAEPRIWICNPVPAYPERWGISDSRIKDEVIPLAAKVARKRDIPVIDLYDALRGKPELFPDLIHPNAEGAYHIAREVYAALTGLQFTGEYAEPAPAKVLIIGDSISIGYFRPVQEMLEGRAIVEHNPGNAAHTANGLARLDEWLGDTKWDVIHFNHGLHDLKYIDEKGKNAPAEQGKQQIPIDQYEKNLDEMVRRLKKTGAKLIFANTTPVPDGTGIRVKGDAKIYNVAAERVMKKHGVPVNDLYSFSMARLEKIQRLRNVHFFPEGSRLLGEQVTKYILKVLDEQ
ncbi:MAG: SGNH/GDSL hydrolase family protein [Planctomycetes bacterium]|nr:SGNH/GDSL hydrolase family protein [Planctomycetota bacterium]MBL7184869.1 SGNH/GDSL hydrolase family protein [Phycisphaerae bacterium]